MLDLDVVSILTRNGGVSSNIDINLGDRGWWILGIIFVVISDTYDINGGVDVGDIWSIGRW
jgi:hypothetical protein